MQKTKTERLSELIKTLTSSEKRNFNLNAKRSGRAKMLYFQLYEYLEKHEVYDEEKILKKINGLKRTQLSNVKANLYRQILRSLRDLNKDAYVEIKAREHFDFAKVLYAKGHYQSSLEMLQKVKRLARQSKNDPLVFLALSFEKQIESQHVTGSMSPKAIALENESNKLIESLILRNQLSNLSLQFYGIFLEKGYAKNEADRRNLENYYYSKLPDVDTSSLDFYQRLFLFQSKVWYFSMRHEFAQSYKWAQRWVDLFDEFPEMKVPETSVFIKGIHNVLNSLFMSNRLDRFDQEFNRLVEFNNSGLYNLSRNENTQLQLYKFTHQINRVFLKTNYAEEIDNLTDLEMLLTSDLEPWDLDKRLTLHYKIACVYFGANKFEKTIFHLSKITNFYFPDFKLDVQCFARILKLIAHFDQGDTLLVSYQVKSVYRFLLKMKEMQKAQKEIFKFIRKTTSMAPNDMPQEFIKLRDKLIPLENELLERRPFLYLDIISWLNSKIYKISMVEAIRQRRGIK